MQLKTFDAASRQSRFPRWNTIRNRVFFSILCFLIAPVLISMYLLDKPLERTIEHKIGESNQDALSLVTYNVKLLLDDMVQASVEMTLQADIRSVLKDPGQYSKYEKLRLSDAAFKRVFSSYFTNTDITLIDRYGGWLSTSYVPDAKLSAYTGSDWYSSLMSQPYRQLWMSGDSRMLYLEQRPMVTLVKAVSDFPEGQNLGSISFSVPETDVRKMLRGLDGAVYLLDKEDRIVSAGGGGMQGQQAPEEIVMAGIHSSRQGQSIVEKDGRKWIVSHDTIGLNGWTTVQMVPYDKVFEEIVTIRRTNMLVLAAIFIVFTIVTLSISNGMSKPLRLLRKKMTELESKQFHSTIQVAGPQEIAALSQTYNDMVREIRHLLQRVKQEYEQKEDMRFRALQSQINPHFLLNTLNNIKWLAYLRKDDEVGDMLSSLGGILEGSIGRDGSLATLRQELDYIGSYMNLMKMSLGAVSLEIDVPDELLDQEALKMMLQPVVENCLMHGLKDKASGGAIRIEALRKEEQVIVAVSDNGAGMAEAKLMELRKRLEADAQEEPSRRIGIKNVHDRIRLQYGKPYGIKLDSMEGNGTTVTVLLPARKGREGHGGEA